MKALVLLPDPEQPGLTEPERVALRIRNAATVTGRCACGNRVDERAVTPTHAIAAFAHEHDCPAVSPVLERLARRLGSRLVFMAVVVDATGERAA